MRSSRTRQDASLQAGMLVSAHALAFLKGPVSFGSEAPEILRGHDRRTARMLIRIGREDVKDFVDLSCGAISEEEYSRRSLEKARRIEAKNKAEKLS